jgi:hypothetical protein
MIQVGPRALSLLLVAVLLSLLAPRAALGNASLSAGALDDQVSPQESQEECSPEVESWTASRLEETDRCECGTLASGSLLAAKGGAKYGATPKGRPLTKHYGTGTGPKRNIPGSVVDNTIDTTPGVPGKNGTTVHYDPANNVTVVTGDGGSIVSAHKGKP